MLSLYHRGRGAILVAVVVGQAFLTGCDNAAPPPPPAVVKPPTPTERFDRFIAALKRWVESDDTRVAVAQGDLNVDPGTPVTSWQSRVEHRILKPEEEGGELRAEVAIRTRSTVSMVMTPSDEEEDEKQKAADREEERSEDAIDLPPELRNLKQAPATGSLDRLRSSPIVERKDEHVSRYELAYRDDKWVLLTELDTENEPFNSGAVEHALRQQ